MRQRLLPLLCSLSLISAVHAQNCVPAVKFPKTTKVPIRRVVFEDAPLLSAKDQEEISAASGDAEVIGELSKENLADAADEVAERVRAFYQNNGYFKVQVVGKALRVPDDRLREYDILVRVVNQGEQYRLRDLTFVNATVFPEVQMRDLFPVQRGEIFSREKIAKGLEELRRLYGAQGYINYTGVPSTQFDDDTPTADLTIDVDQGKRFRWGNIRVLGLDSETRTRLIESLNIKTGDIYNSESWNRLAARFPDLALNDPRVQDKRLNEKDGIVDIGLDFRKTRPCPTDLAAPGGVELQPSPPQ